MGNREVNASASPPQDAPRRVEVATDKQFSGTWNNWIAPFHLCAYCSESLNWEKTVDVLDRPWITAKCACGIIYSARLSADDLARARAVDDGNKLAASILSGLAPTPPAVTAEDIAWLRGYLTSGDDWTAWERESVARILALLEWAAGMKRGAK